MEYSQLAGEDVNFGQVAWGQTVEDLILGNDIASHGGLSKGLTHWLNVDLLAFCKDYTQAVE